MKRIDLINKLASWTDDNVLAIVSLSSNSPMWINARPKGVNFLQLNLGLCVPFALGVSLAFPHRKVIALDSDGSFMLDTSVLITMAEMDAPNLLTLIMDNGRYARMGQTATARGVVDLAGMARAAGIERTATIRSESEFERHVKPAVTEPGPAFFVAKVEPEATRVKADPRLQAGPKMKETFIDSVLAHPDYQRWR